MSEPLGADTDLLRSDKLTPAFQIMSEAGRKFRLAMEANMPPGTVRCETDEKILAGLKDSTSLVTDIISGITALSHGDTRNVDWLSKTLAKVEEDNIDASKGGRRPDSGDGNVHH